MSANIGGVIALAIAALGVAFAILLYRAAPHRRDNVVFAALAGVDSVMTAWRGLNVLAGESIIGHAVTLPCSIMTIVLSVLTFEFITGFPRRRPMAWTWRGPLLAWCAATAVLLGVQPDHLEHLNLAQSLFFAPATLLILYCGYRSWRATSERAARMVIATLWFRWIFGFGAYFFAPRIDMFEPAMWAETTVATMLSFVVIGTSVLRSELFSIRSTVAEAVTLATIALLVILGGGTAIWAVTTYSEPGTLQQALLVGATFVPLGLAAFGYAIYPRVERRVLAGFDERRARRLHVQGDPLPTDASEAIAEANHRISVFGDGSKVRWVAAASLDDDVARSFRDGLPALRKDEQASLPACLIVPAHGADGALVGAFYIDHGTIDRDTYLVARDLAARIALAVERAEAVAALDDARHLAALGQFAAAIAHDIRTPLTSISLNVQILRRKLQLPDDDREHLDIALEELARLDKSVGEILDFAKPVKLASEAIDIGELLDTTARGLSPVLSEKGVSLRLEPEAPDGLTVHGDAKRLRQVLTNLVDNAADASGSGAEVILRATAAHDHVAIEVEDTGRGIESDDLPKIFEPFFTRRPDGTGLGLAICHKVVRAHGGDIKVRSVIGAGSTFTVLLPAA